MGRDLSLELWYNVKTGMFGVNSNIKPEHQNEIVSDFIRGQRGAGKDNRKADVRDVYEIALDLDLSGDVYSVSHNCGNKSLREGILMEFLKIA